MTTSLPTSPVQFWHAFLGQYLFDADPATAGYPKMSLPTRMKKGVDLNTLGGMISAHYIVTPEHSYLIGKIEMENTDKVSFIPTDDEKKQSGQAFISQWLIDADLTTPFMIGVITNANPVASFKISSAELSYYCESNKGQFFNAYQLKDIYSLINESGLSWKKDILPALYIKKRLDLALLKNTTPNEREKGKLIKSLEKTPELGVLLRELQYKLKMGSGEHAMLAPLFR